MQVLELKLSLIFLDGVNTSLQVLKHTKESFDEVKEHWRKTAKIRYSQLINDGKTDMSSYLEPYPALKQSWGHKLISIDFEELHKIEKTVIFVEWESFFTRFYETASKRNFRNAVDLTDVLNDQITESKSMSFFIISSAVLIKKIKKFLYRYTNSYTTTVTGLYIPAAFFYNLHER